jgi:exosortase
MKNVHLPFHMLSRKNLALGLKIATIVAAALAIFYQDLVIIANDALQTEFMSHILAIPFLLAYLIYRKRKMLRAVTPLENQDQPKKTRHLSTIAGIILSTTAMLVYWYGSYTFTPLEYHMFALPIFVAGLTLILFNPQTLRQLAFPLAFLIFLMPPPSEITYALGSTLSVISSEASYTIISSLGIPSTLTSEYDNPIIQITRPDGAAISFAVDIACSGIYSLIGFLVFAVFIAYIIRDKPWKKIALFLIGFSLIYALNITRITTILLIGYRYGEEIALQLFHLLGGWILIFLGTLLLLIISEKILHTQIFTKPQECSECNPNPETNHNFCLACGRILKSAPIRFHKTDIIKIAAITVSVIMLVSIQAPVFALTEGPAQITIQTPTGEQGNTQLLPQIQGYTLAFIYRDKNFEERARQDASLIYAYLPLDNTKESIWVAVEIGSSTSLLHRWEVCLISWQIKHGWPAYVEQLDLKDIQIQENPPIIARYFAFQWVKTNQTQVVLYWYETSRFMTNSTAPEEKRVKISLITYPNAPQNITEAENLLPFATGIANHWQPIKTWTQIALLLSQNGAYLAAITTALLATVTVLYSFEARKQRKANAKAYQKLSKPNKQIIDIVLETEKSTTPTLSAIAIRHKNRTGEPIREEKLLHRLSEAEKTGIIKSAIASIQDEPTQIWKTQISRKTL